MNRTLQRLKSHDYGAILEDLGIIRAGMVIFPEKRRLAAYRIPGVPAGMLFVLSGFDKYEKPRHRNPGFLSC